jgi:hypothetical protein
MAARLPLALPAILQQALAGDENSWKIGSAAAFKAGERLAGWPLQTGGGLPPASCRGLVEII